MKKIRQLVLVGLAVALVMSLVLPALAREVLPPSIMPVIILEGSDYEMGYQYGQQAGQYIEAKKNSKWVSRLKSRTYDEVLEALKGVQHYVQEYTPELISQMKGMADGATAAGYDLSYIDVLLINSSLPSPTSTTTTYPEGAEEKELPLKNCSNFTAWGSTTTDGSLLCADSFDGSITYQLIVVAFPDEGNNWMGAMAAGQLSSHFAMNNKGLFLGNSGGGGSKRSVDSDYGINWLYMFQHLARFADTAAEATEMTLPWQLNGVENFQYVDINGGAFVVEKTAAIQSVRKSGDFGETDFLYATNNYLCDEMRVTKEGQEFVGKHGGYGDYAAPRNLFLWDMLSNYRGKIDLEFIKMMWRFPGTPPPYPPDEGWDPAICRPTNMWVTISLPDDGDKGVTYVCTGPVGQVIHASPTSRGGVMNPVYLLVDGTHTFYELTLAKDPAAVVGAAKNAAKADIATAYGELMMLTPLDSGYVALNEIYSEANAEYYEGLVAYDKGMLASGNEALSYFAQAATALTRCQAHALQVYEALVSPATSPSDLGLRPFGEAWGEWERKVGAAK